MDLDDAKIKKIIDSKIIGLRYLWTLKKGISMGLNWFMFKFFGVLNSAMGDMENKNAFLVSRFGKRVMVPYSEWWLFNFSVLVQLAVLVQEQKKI